MKVDQEFIAEFVKDCMAKNKTTSVEICNAALERIAEIDELFKERNQLSNVLKYFNNKKRTCAPIVEVKSTINDIDKQIASNLLCTLKTQTSISIKELINSLSNKETNCKKNYFYTLKQLLENKILLRSDNDLLKGDNFSTFSNDI